MALDFKTMSLEKKIVVCGSLVLAAFGLIALIISFCVYGSVTALMEGEAAKAAKALGSLFSGKSYDPGNPLGSLNWVLVLTFLASLAIAAIGYFKAPKSSLAPQVPFNLVIPAVTVLTFLFVWLYFATSKDSAGFLEGKGVALGIFALIFVLAYTAMFAFFAYEKKDDLMKALPYCILALGGLFLLIAVIRGIAYPGIEKATTKALLAGKDSIPSPLGLVKTAFIINSLCLIGYGCLTFLKAKDED